MELFDSIRRRRLTQKGLSSGKKRRTQADGPVAVSLDRSNIVRYSVYALFVVCAALLAFDHAETSGENGSPYASTLSIVLAAGMVVALFECFHPKTAHRNGHVFLVFFCLAFQLASIWLVTVMVDANPALSQSFKLLLIPYGFAPMVLSVLLGSRLGLYATGTGSLLGAFLMPKEAILTYLVMSVVCGLAVVLVTRQVRKRGRLLRAGLRAREEHRLPRPQAREHHARLQGLPEGRRLRVREDRLPQDLHALRHARVFGTRDRPGPGPQQVRRLVGLRHPDL